MSVQGGERGELTVHMTGVCVCWCRGGGEGELTAYDRCVCRCRGRAGGVDCAYDRCVCVLVQGGRGGGVDCI